MSPAELSGILVVVAIVVAHMASARERTSDRDRLGAHERGAGRR